MASRFTFGSSSGDLVTLAASSNSGVVKAAANQTATGTFWSAQTGGTQYTDLVDPNNGFVAITGISTDANGRPKAFQGPAGITLGWVDFGAGRFLMVAQEAQGDPGLSTLIQAAGSLAQQAWDGRYYTKTALDTHVNDPNAALFLNPGDVRRWGAKGDGVADDTTAIQNAITANVAPVFFPPGTYKISAALNLVTGSHLIGSGSTSVIRQTVDTFGIRATSVNNLIIESLTIQGFGVTSTANQGLVHMTGSTKIKILNCRIYNHQVGVWITSSNDILISGNEVDTFHAYGVVLSTSNYWRVIGNEIHDSSETGAVGTYGISASGSSPTYPQKACKIIGNDIYNIPSWDAIMSHETADLTIADNWMSNVRTGIDIGPNGGTPTNARLVISGNTILGTTTDTWAGASAQNSGIQLIGQSASYVEEFAITGNVVEHFNYFTASAGAGGILLNQVRDGAVSGNIIKDIGNAVTSMGGVSVIGTVQGVGITGNECVDTAAAGVAFYNVPQGEGINVTGNTFRKVSSASMANGVLNESGRFVDSRIASNVVRGSLGYFAQSGSLFAPTPPLTDILETGQIARAIPMRDAIAKVGSSSGGDTLGARLRYLTFRLDTTTTASVASGSTTIPVASNAGLAANDVIYVVLDNGAWLGSFLTSAGTGTVITNDAVPAGRTIPNGSSVWIVRWASGA